MYPHVVHAGSPIYIGHDVKELGRDNDTLRKNYACDCCGTWMPVGTDVVLITYAFRNLDVFNERANEQDVRATTGRSLRFHAYCIPCVGVRV